MELKQTVLRSTVALLQLAVVSINRFHFPFCVLLWQRFNAVFVDDSRSFVELRLLLLLFYFLPI